jgi:hypothetical protein
MSHAITLIVAHARHDASCGSLAEPKKLNIICQGLKLCPAAKTLHQKVTAKLAT